ncbi:MAG TPA: hypothetical protein VKU42_05585 [Candidatus Angelobacter sp.]|nr:hypothetical protein [Candidatus Angelobacter sp.]
MAALAAVSLFWMVYFAYRHPPTAPTTTSALSSKELIDELNTIKVPVGAKKVVSPAAIPSNDPKNHAVVAAYLANSECKDIAEHYKEEFARHGFVNRPLRSDAHKKLEYGAFFCGHGVSAQLGCISQPEGHLYMIQLRSQDDTCAD